MLSCQRPPYIHNTTRLCSSTRRSSTGKGEKKKGESDKPLRSPGGGCPVDEADHPGQTERGAWACEAEGTGIGPRLAWEEKLRRDDWGSGTTGEKKEAKNDTRLARWVSGRCVGAGRAKRRRGRRGRAAKALTPSAAAA